MKRSTVKVLQGVRALEPGVVVSCLLALALLVPLRSLATASPVVAFAAVLVLFMAPGVLLAGWFAPGLFPGPALLPAALALGTGVYGLIAIPVLLLHLSLNFYLAACGIVLALFLVAAVIVAVALTGNARSGRQEPADEREEDPGAWLLWVPFILLGGGLVVLTGVKVPYVDGDTWNYLAWVRDYLEPGRLAVRNPYFGTETGASRVLINGFLLEQAALSRVSGIDPVTLALWFLSPVLAAASLLAFYALGRRLFGQGPALLAGCIYALFLLAHLNGELPLFGKEFLGRVIQDKGVARFVFLPVALCLAAGYLEERRIRYLLLFGFVCWASVVVHPAGLAVIGLSAAGFGLLHVVSNLRRSSAWTGATALGMALLSILAVPAGYVLATGRSLSSELYSADIGDSDPTVLANQVFVRETWMNIFVLDNGSYIMHPSLILEPAIVAAYVLGVPFLLWRLRPDGRAGGGSTAIAAQLLLGTLLAATVASYVPPIATFLGDNVVAPGQLHRLSWPIPLAAFLTLGWVLWTAVRWGIGKLGLAAWIVPLVVLGLIVAMMAQAKPRVVPAMTEIYRYKDIQQGGPGARLDPVFWWMGRNITEPAVVLAPDSDNLAIPAYSADANVVSFRGAPVLKNLAALERVSGKKIEVPQGARDVQEFYGVSTPERRLEIVRRQDASYILVPTYSPLAQGLVGAPGLTRLETPGDRYVLFSVDQAGLDG